MNVKRPGSGVDSISHWVGKPVEPLLQTKLFIPRVRRGMVPRRQLVDRLDNATQDSLCLVSAPPGFGKTTLLAEWATQSPTPVAWLSLDLGDNDLGRFFSYLAAALIQIDPKIGEEALRLLGSAQPYTPELVIASLLNRIEMLQVPFVLVLDDYHLIAEASVHKALTFLLDHQPEQIHLIIASRADPPFPLARLRALGQMQELRANDLRFSAGETSAFLREIMGLSLSAEDILALERRTEGWVAGLQMAALSMQGRKDLSSFVQAFSGSHRFILDYLVEEVLNRQPEAVQTFLLRTSILEHLSSPLCETLLEIDRIEQKGPDIITLAESLTALGPKNDSQSILEYLERSNLFLTPLDDERRWYRYHALFADLLRARLLQAQPEIVPRLHSGAAGWYEQNGLVREAVHHAFAAQDDVLAADLIEEHGHKHWSLNDGEFLALVGRLPAEVLEARPRLGLYFAWILFISGQYEAAEKLLYTLLDHIPPTGPTREDLGLRSFANLLLIYIAESSTNTLLGEMPDRHALDFVPEHHLGMRNSVEVLYAFLLDHRGDFAASEQLLLTTVQRDIAARGTTAVPICISRLARNWILQGRLREAAGLCRKYIAYIREQGELGFFIGGNLYLALAGILREWNDLEEAEQMIQTGIRVNEPWQYPQVDMAIYSTKARLQQARGDVDGALATLDQLEPLVQGKSTRPDLASDLRALKVNLWLAKGNRANAWSQISLSQPVEPLDFQHEQDHILLARLFIADGKEAEAIHLLERLAYQAEVGNRSGRLLEIRLLETLALSGLKRTSLAFEKLEACLAMAEPEGYLRIFLDEGEGMQTLLSLYLRRPAPAHAAYVGRILQAFVPTEQSHACKPGEQVEALTPRELEVLELICAGSSNQEIAERLVVSVSTVKKHTGNVYGKLGVSSRTQAIARARQLNLFSSER